MADVAVPGATEEELATLRKALAIGQISHDGDGWFAKEAGYDYDDAEATLRAALGILDRLAPAPPSSDAGSPIDVERLAHPFTAGGPLHTTCGWRDPVTGRECLQAPASRTHRESVPVLSPEGRPCLLCLDGAGMDHNGRYRVLSAMGRDGEFHERLELCPCKCHGEEKPK